MLIKILQIIVAVGTILTGLFSLLKPNAIRGFTGLIPDGGRGITEIRSIMGGVFIGLGAAALILNANAAWQMLGIMYLVVALIRLVSMFMDKSIVRSNIISLAAELVFGVILMF